MRKLLFVCLLTYLATSAKAADFTVTYIRGSVFYKNRQLQIGDDIAGTDKLYAPNNSAVVALIHPVFGNVYLSFSDVKEPTKKAKKESLYELVVDKFFHTSSSSGRLTTMGDFDLNDFLTDTTGNPYNRLLLVSGQSLPLKAVAFQIYRDDKFYICRTDKSNCNLLPRTDDSLKIDLPPDASGTPLVTCNFERRFTVNGKEKVQRFSRPAEVQVIGADELKKIIGLFFGQLKGYYRNDSKLLRKALYEHFSYFYGKFYEDSVYTMMDDFLKN